MAIGDRIKARRELLGISQEELAKKLGYKSRSSINKIELGKNDITQHKVVSFAKALETTPAYLMGWATDTPSYQKADTISDVIIKLRSDDELLEIVKDVCSLNNEQRVVIKTLLSAFNKDSE
jgi:transcriptional regulator with XRE-family HTH domain